MKRLALLALAVLGLLPRAHAQIDAIQGFCNQGGLSSVTSGLQSANKLQGIVPSCTIKVYLTGTQTPAKIGRAHV